MRSWVALILLATTVGLADEAPQNRRSSIGFKFGGGKDDYRSETLNANVGLSPEWLLRSSLSGTQNNTTDGSGEIRLGPDWLSQELPIGAYFEFIGRREPDEVRAGGLGTGFLWTLSELWHAHLHTDLTLDLQFLRYTQGSQPRQQRINGNAIPQNSVGLGLSQEITQDLAISAGFTAYGYGNASQQTLARLISQRPDQVDGLLNVINGFPRQAFLLRGDWVAIPDWTFSLSASSTRLAVPDATGADRINTVGMGVAWNATQNWSFSIDVSGSRDSNHQSAGSLVLVGVKYAWY